MTHDRNADILRDHDAALARLLERRQVVYVDADWLHRLLDAARQQGRDEAELKAGKNAGYFYRRALFAEEGLRTVVLTAEAVNDGSGVIPELELQSCAEVADTILAESRKEELPNYEDFIRDRRQKQVLRWATRAFGDVASDPYERALRFLEEAVELFQAAAVTARVSAPEAASRVQNTMVRVFSKPPGDLNREFGGTLVTLLALAETLDVSLSTEEKAEFARILSIRPEEWRDRHAKKHDAGITVRQIGASENAEEC